MVRRDTRGLSGLTAFEVVVQSTLCHPDWDAIVHTQYLRSEEDLDAHPELVASWLAEARRIIR